MQGFDALGTTDWLTLPWHVENRFEEGGIVPYKLFTETILTFHERESIIVD